MKRTAFTVCILLLIMAASLLAASCSGSTSSTTQATTQTSSTTTSQAPIKLTITHGNTQTGFQQVYFEEWGEKLVQLTNGKVEIEVYPMNTFAAPTDLHDAIINGVVDIAHDFLGYYAGRFPRTEVIDLPLGPWVESQAKGGYIGQKLLEGGYFGDEFNDLKPLWWGCGPPEQLHTTVKVATLEDFKGLRIRKPGVIGGKWVEALGASVVSMSATDVYLALQKGTIDGMPYGTGDLLQFKTDEVTNFTTDIAFGITSQPVMMNLAKWNSLPSDVQQAITELSGMNGTKDYCDAWAAWNTNLAQPILDRPGRLTVVAPEEVAKMSAAVEPVWDWWVQEREGQGVPAQEILDAAIAFGEEYDKQ